MFKEHFCFGVVYPKCTPCQKAKKWPDDNKIEYETVDIKENDLNSHATRVAITIHERR